jgi:hypothetical protein
MAGNFISWKKKTLLLKKETTAGTDAIPTPALNAVRATNVTLTLEGDEVTNSNELAYFENDEISWSNKTFKIKGEILMYGSGTAGTAPAYSPLIIACGHSETIVASTSVTYKPVSDSTETATLYFYIGTILYKATYSKGKADFAFGIGEFSKMNFEFTGVYVEPADVALPTPVYTTGTTVVGSKANSTLSVHGTLVDGQTMTLDTGVVNSAFESTETFLIGNDDRKSSANMTLNANPLASFNPYSINTANTKAVVYWETGTVAGNIIRANMPKGQLGLPQVSEIKSRAGFDIDVIPFATTGDDEYELIFT